jgi:hypothetical protein
MEPATHRWKLTTKASEALQHLLGARHAELRVRAQPVPDDSHGLVGIAVVCLRVLPADVRAEFQVRVLLALEDEGDLFALASITEFTGAEKTARAPRAC